MFSSPAADRSSASPGTVATVGAAEIDRQAYRLSLDDSAIQTLLQLVKRDAAGRLRLPTVTIEDWPAFEWRFLHLGHQTASSIVARSQEIVDFFSPSWGSAATVRLTINAQKRLRPIFSGVMAALPIGLPMEHGSCTPGCDSLRALPVAGKGDDAEGH